MSSFCTVADGKKTQNRHRLRSRPIDNGMIMKVPSELPAASADAALVLLRRLMAGVNADLSAMPSREADRIHDIRVGMKKFRAILALLDKEIPARTLKEADRLARELKGHFSSSRDTEVLRDLLLDLLHKEKASQLVSELALGETQGSASDSIPAAQAVALRLGALVAGWRLKKTGNSILLEGWMRTYRSARRTLKMCEKDGDDFLFHEWRKRIKELLYQSLILPASTARAWLVPRAEALAATLGHQHDLALLDARFAEHLPDHRAARIVAKKKRRLAARALSQGRRLLAEKPSTLRKKLTTQ